MGLFRMGVIFAQKTKARKTRKLHPHEICHINSIQTESSHGYVESKTEGKIQKSWQSFS